MLKGGVYLEKMKKIYRSRKDKVLVGVCGGLGDYFDIDPVLIRIIFILLCFVRGIGFLVYLISALIIPSEPEKERQKSLQITSEKAQSLLDELAKKSWYFYYKVDWPLLFNVLYLNNEEKTNQEKSFS